MDFPGDPLEIGWFCRDTAGKVHGPFDLQVMRGLTQRTAIGVDAEVRHSLEADYCFAGDREELWQTPKESQHFPCLRHPKRKAEQFCWICGATLCKSCAHQGQGCRSCYFSTYHRSLLAGLVDYPVLWLVAVYLPWMGWVDEWVRFPLLFAYWCLKDGWGRFNWSKRLARVRLVDAESGRPAGLGAALIRNGGFVLMTLITGVVALTLSDSPQSDRWVERAVTAYLAVAWFTMFLWLFEAPVGHRNPQGRGLSDLLAGVRLQPDESLVAARRRWVQARWDKLYGTSQDQSKSESTPSELRG